MPVTHAQLWKAVDALAARRGLTPSGLARKAGLDPTSFNPSKRIGPGDPPRPRWPSTESLTLVLEATGASLGEFAALAQDGPAARDTIPLLGLAQAGADGFFDANGFPAGDGWDETQLPVATDTTISIRIQGDSMTPLYRPGDRVIVDRADRTVRKGDRVVVQTTAGEVVAKEVAAITATRVTLASINPAYPPRILPMKDVAWMSRILWVSQ
jgi:phage repressor protein C with HTH and peptisase S24 domain